MRGGRTISDCSGRAGCPDRDDVVAWRGVDVYRALAITSADWEYSASSPVERYCSNSSTNEISFVDRATPLGALRLFCGRGQHAACVVLSPSSARPTPSPPVTLISARPISCRPRYSWHLGVPPSPHPTCSAGKDEVRPSPAGLSSSARPSNRIYSKMLRQFATARCGVFALIAAPTALVITERYASRCAFSN